MVSSFEFSIILQLFQTVNGVSNRCSEILSHIFTEWLYLHLQLKDLNKSSTFLEFLSVHQVKKCIDAICIFYIKRI